MNEALFDPDRDLLRKVYAVPKHMMLGIRARGHPRSPTEPVAAIVVSASDPATSLQGSVRMAFCNQSQVNMLILSNKNLFL